MKQEQMYYFRAEEKKVEEILKILEELGGKRYCNYCAKSDHCIFYISPGGWIERAEYNSQEHALHDPTPEQIAIGVENHLHDQVKQLLTFEGMPKGIDVLFKATALSEIALKYKFAMIGGAPFFMSILEKVLMNRGTIPLYAFSKRVSVDVHNADGSVTKTQQFKHEGFMFASKI